ncbi:hypothetical protein [uncultured Helicobacter sp.]|uniref:hypothetical protein n=1 Tax=uncultured Helicobacter sp. TaxID=175537 RepID=UPI00374FB1DB
MSLNYEQQMTIAIAQGIITKYGAVLQEADLAKIFGLSEATIRNKFSQGTKDLPRYTQLKGKRVVMAQDLAEFMVQNTSKF